MSAALGFDRASLLRHLAISLATAAAYLLRVELQVGNGVLWILGAAALLNFLSYLFSARPRAGPLLRGLSPIFGVGSWAALVHMTGGHASPFIAGFWLEVVLSSLSLSARGTVVVTALGAAALWVQQAALGLGGAITPLVLKTAFLAAMGGVMLLVTRVWSRAHGSLDARYAALAARLRDLEGELDEVRAVGRVGENVARLAHGLKNAVHSLRGFAALLEPEMLQRARGQAALDGLRAAIDRLEELARMTLGDPGRKPAGRSACSGLQAHAAIEEAAAEVATSFPAIRWVRDFDAAPPPVRATPEALREVLLVLLRNAAEAMEGRGEVVLSTHATREGLRIEVRDHGRGLGPEELSVLFRPGFTTKPEGSGYGLFLARRLLESFGGRLTATPGAGGGAELSISLPSAEA